MINMKKKLEMFQLLFAALLWLLVIVIFLNNGFYLTANLLTSHQKPSLSNDVIREYNYFKALLDKPDNKQKTQTDGFSGFQSSEWPFMTLSLSTFAMRNLALRHPELKQDIALTMKKAIERAKKEGYYHFIVSHYGDPFTSDEIEDNAFYLGHFTLMLAYYREISGDPTYDELFHKFAQAFYQNYEKSPTVHLSSYQNFTWVSEQAVPLKALKIHDDIFGTNYKSVLYKWRDFVKENYLLPQTGLLVTDIDKDSGAILSGERTIPNAWAILFLYDVLPDFAGQLYTNLRKENLIKRLGIPFFKEFAGEKQVATGDTGPIIWGIAPASSVFGMGCAGIMKDYSVYFPLKYLTDVFGLSFTYGEKRKYVAGGSIGTAAMFWVKSAVDEQAIEKGNVTAYVIVLLYLIILSIIIFCIFRLKLIFRTIKIIKDGTK